MGPVPALVARIDFAKNMASSPGWLGRGTILAFVGGGGLAILGTKGIQWVPPASGFNLVRLDGNQVPFWILNLPRIQAIILIANFQGNFEGSGFCFCIGIHNAPTGPGHLRRQHPSDPLPDLLVDALGLFHKYSKFLLSTSMIGGYPCTVFWTLGILAMVEKAVVGTRVLVGVAL